MNIKPLVLSAALLFGISSGAYADHRDHRHRDGDWAAGAAILGYGIGAIIEASKDRRHRRYHREEYYEERYPRRYDYPRYPIYDYYEGRYPGGYGFVPRYYPYGWVPEYTPPPGRWVRPGYYDK